MRIPLSQMLPEDRARLTAAGIGPLGDLPNGWTFEVVSDEECSCATCECDGGRPTAGSSVYTVLDGDGQPQLTVTTEWCWAGCSTRVEAVSRRRWKIVFEPLNRLVDDVGTTVRLL